MTDSGLGTHLLDTFFLLGEVDYKAETQWLKGVLRSYLKRPSKSSVLSLVTT